MTLEEKLSLVERATWEAIQSREGQEVITSQNWVQITSPFAPTAFMNGVLRCELSETERNSFSIIVAWLLSSLDSSIRPAIYEFPFFKNH